MRRHGMHGGWALWAIVAVVGLGYTGGALNGQQEAARPPVLKFENTSVQLGQIRGGVKANCSFAFVNSGPHPVEIVEARPGCGCLLPQLDQRKFAAGQSGCVPLELRTLGQPEGPHTWHLTLTYRDGEELREQALQVTANVVNDVSIQPASLMVYMTSGAGVSPQVTLVDRREKPLKIIGMTTTSPHLKAEEMPLPKVYCDWAVHAIQVRAAAEMPIGRHDEQLVIHTDDPVYCEFKIPVTVVHEGASRIVASPSEVTLRGPRMLRVRDRQDEIIVIESVVCDQPGVMCKWAPGPDNQATIKLEMDASKVADGVTNAIVRVQVSSPVRELLTIPVRWGDD